MTYLRTYDTQTQAQTHTTHTYIRAHCRIPIPTRAYTHNHTYLHIIIPAIGAAVYDVAPALFMKARISSYAA